jgi:exosortase
MQTLTRPVDSKSRTVLIAGSIALLVVVVLAYGSTFAWLVRFWYEVQDYVYGFLVIPFAALLLWDRREMIKDAEFKGNLWGLPFLAIAAAMRGYSAYEFIPVAEALSLIPLLLGLVILVGGWKALQWSWPGIAFLTFMVPLPGRYADLLSRQLQQIGTQVSVYTLQTLGVRAVAEGNVIVLSNARLGVVEACSGIRMLMLFFAACIGAALIIRRDLFTRILIALSAIPIAIVANVTRITVTAILYETVSQELGDKVFHDLAGWFMMPMAIGILWLETALFAKLFTAPERDTPLAFGTLGEEIPRDGESRFIRGREDAAAVHKETVRGKEDTA